MLNGNKLSYNNYNDIFSALSFSKSFPKNRGTVIIKHANPCGASIEKKQLNSYNSALSCDPVSAYGGIVACNYKINNNLALELSKIFYEVIIANGFNKDAIKILKRKKNLRIIDEKIHQIDGYRAFTITVSASLTSDGNDPYYPQIEAGIYLSLIHI